MDTTHSNLPSPSGPSTGEERPAQLGRYRILETIGIGGMGTVYKAQDPHLDRLVAIKVPRFDGAEHTQASRRQRFQREARAAAQVRHPHVCPVYDVGEHEGRPFVVMACIEGVSLSEYLHRHGRYEQVDQAVALIRQVLDGLDAIHVQGIVHRDLKPSNILLDRVGNVILMDFGLSRAIEEADHLTSDGVVVGTPAYMAPEQATGQSDRVGPWTDLYAAGVVLYQMLTGRLPFEGPPLAVLSQIRDEAPPVPSSLRADLDPALEGVVLLAMAKQPGERYQSARLLAQALEGWARKLPAETAPSVTPGSEPEGEPPVHNPHLSDTRGTGLKVPRVKSSLANEGMWIMLGILGVFVVAASGCGLVVWWFVDDTSQTSWLSSSRLVFGAALILAGFALMICSLNVREPRAFLSAAAQGRVDCVNALLRTRLLNANDELGETALMKAAENGHGAIVRALLAHGADASRKNVFGQTALMLAEAKGHADIVALLEQAEGKE
jgi:serine/threonine protein kinase